MQINNLVIRVTVSADLNEVQLKSLVRETQRDYPEHFAKVTEWSNKKTVITCDPRHDVLARLSII